MTEFRQGNVVQLHGRHLVIITNVQRKHGNDEYYNWISFSYSNSSGGTPWTTTEEEQTCQECQGSGYCDECGGKGYVTHIRHGMDQAELLADNVKEYILKGLTKNFEW